MRLSTLAVSFARCATWVAVIAAGALDPQRASACGLAACVQGWFMPADGDTVPANAPALAWRVPQDFESEETLPVPEVHMSRIAGDKLVPIEVTLESGTSGLTWIHPASALVPRTRYRLVVEASSCATPAVEFETSEQAPLPEDLGTVVVTKPRDGDIRVATNSGACDTELPAVISSVDLDFSDQAVPWSALLVYRINVDGDLWAPSWSLGPADASSVADPKTKVFSECPGHPLSTGRPVDTGAFHQGLPEGKHAVAIEARLPGRDRVLKTSEKTVELSCTAQAMASKSDKKSSSSRGCSAAPRGRTAPPATWVLAALALSYARALRRSRNARGVSPVQRRNARKNALGSA